ncbi:hypothetical protein [Spiroplasma attinicola]|uniref:hypothetical protein n=1 Tax=Spiroplasma attinicola TaxID=2904537 RepID=UPI0020229D2B|nr:hypothetical protein [Spiroplasma sp. JKS002670]MCL8209904.1 hypothetical protein [Spiroplasma sp. JKS002670]
MRKCGHKDNKDCAWNNADDHENHLDEEQYRACFSCGGRMNKGAYEGKQEGTGDETWNIHHIDSNPKNNICENLVATHPECNRDLD